MIVPINVDYTILDALDRWFPDARNVSDVPPDWDWGNPVSALIVSTIVGGQGIRDHVMDHARVTFEVYDRNPETAADMARRLYGHLMHWQYERAGVFYNGTVVRPTYHPIGGGGGDPSFTPGYWLTVELIFRASEAL